MTGVHMGKVAITGARLIDPACSLDTIGDIFLADGVIAAVGAGVFASGIPDGAEHIEADGLIVCPGLIDMRVVTGEPGAEHKETIASAGQAAAAGGVTSMVIMPNTDPVIDDISLVDYIRSRGKDSAPVRVYVAGALTKGLSSTAMTELGLMASAGAVMFSNADNPIADTGLMRRIMAYSSTFNALIAHRPVDPSLQGGGCAHESDFSSRLGLGAIPGAAERIMAERDLALAELTGARLLLDQLSSRETMACLKRAKALDLEVFASVSINHLSLNELDIGDYRTFAKLDPPLRAEEDRCALVTALNDGLIDVIVSAHNPRPAGDKRRPFAEAAFGAVGLEILLSAGLTLVADGQLDLMTFLRAVTSNPADILGLEQGRLQEGAPADIVIIDPEKPWVCDVDDLTSLSRNTPFDGRQMQGRAVTTICRGEIVFDTRA